MKKLWLFGLSLCSILLAGCNNGDKGLVDVPNSGINQAESLVVTPKNPHIPVGLPLQLEATATLGDGTTIDVTSNTSLTWYSSNNDIATIDNQGLLTSISTGQVTITAKGINKDGSIVEDTSDVTVTNATVTELLVTPKKPSVAKGLNQAFKAEAIMSDGQVIDVTKTPELTWSSSDTEVASISDDGTNKGQALGLAVGTSEIKAQGIVGDTEFSDTAVLTVNEATIQSFNVSPDVVSIPVGLDSVLKAEVTLTDGSVKNVTQEANWTTTDPTVLDVNNTEGNKGSIHAKKTSTSPVDVTASITVAGTEYTDSAAISVTAATVTTLSVTPETASLPVGLTQEFIAQANLSDGTPVDVTNSAAVSWTTSDSSIATVDKGIVTAVAEGDVTITAVGMVGEKKFSDSATLTVTPLVVTSIKITSELTETPVGLTIPFTATAVFSDKSEVDVTDNDAISWTTRDSSIATVSNDLGKKGIVKGESVGKTTITATGVLGSQTLQATEDVEVTKAVITDFQVTPTISSSALGLSTSFIATVMLSDSTPLDVTNDPEVSWSSSDTRVATVTNGEVDGNGVATGIAVGVTNITASANVNGENWQSSGELTINNATIVGISIDTTDTEVAVDKTLAMKAIGELSDGNTTDLTTDDRATWVIEDTSLASVSNAAEDKGTVTGIKLGSTNITVSGEFDSSPLDATTILTVVGPYRRPLLADETAYEEDTKEEIVYVDSTGTTQMPGPGPDIYGYSAVEIDVAIAECRLRGEELASNPTSLAAYLNEGNDETSTWPLNFRYFWTTKMSTGEVESWFEYRDSVFFNDDTAKFEISGQDPNSHAFVICEHN
ncbi:hypothetical protein GRS44_17440 [Vibrio alginolyticus]|nr:hypothetical protein [Vibrio alginolyticus]